MWDHEQLLVAAAQRLSNYMFHQRIKVLRDIKPCPCCFAQWLLSGGKNMEVYRTRFSSRVLLLFSSCVLNLHVTSFQLCAELAYDTPCFPQTQCWIHHGLSKDAGIIMQKSQAPTLSQRGVPLREISDIRLVCGFTFCDKSKINPA